LSSEVSRAQDAEAAEKVRALAAEDILANAISIERARAKNAEVDERVRAEAAEGVLTTGLSTEVARAGAAEVAIQSQLDTLYEYFFGQNKTNWPNYVAPEN